MDFRDELYLLAITVAMEAGGEPEAGQLAVAYVIVNRDGGVSDAIFKPWQFSAWNTDSPARMNLDLVPDATFRQCYRTAGAAYFGLLPDPSGGATHYLNEEATKKARPTGDLPAWFDEAKVTARIGRHTFLRIV